MSFGAVAFESAVRATRETDHHRRATRETDHHIPNFATESFLGSDRQTAVLARGAREANRDMRGC